MTSKGRNFFFSPVSFSYYRDTNGRATLRDDGFMTTWARRAGKLAFQEAEELNEDNVVTFVNLALFWNGQGSWRLSMLYKGKVLVQPAY